MTQSHNQASSTSIRTPIRSSANVLLQAFLSWLTGLGLLPFLLEMYPAHQENIA